ncbi:MAG: bifunctional nicotinamidase/pyrazinamidase [Deltaproteobacteria bacterium]|nr:MAG: bifunctional nicotinamidase/pyrazinamidase [Deltaproteobacteria bacterium]
MNQPTDNHDKSAVLLVDFQEDFTEDKNGALAVAGTDAAYIDTVARATRALSGQGLPIYATQDWHPETHMSFVTNHPGAEVFTTLDIDGRSQIMWPAHCVQGTAGASIMLADDLFEQVIQKGSDARFDSYSGFADDGGKQTALEEQLANAGIKELLVYGLATDFCVKFTVLDALAAGYRVHLLLDLCRGVAPDTTEAAIEEMREKGAVITESAAFIPGRG